METQVDGRDWALTDKEKQTLRLIVRGHDAKSTARTLGLSVHTINERLREARRKMAVSSSREAARLLLAAEGDGVATPTPNPLGDNEIGEAAWAVPGDQVTGPASRRPWITIGALLMSIALALLALTGLLTPAPAPRQTATAAEAPDPEVVRAAQSFLEQLDRSDWDGSYQAFGGAFRKLNSAEVWARASDHARKPLGAMVSRTFLSQDDVPAPPAGYQVVKFRTSFANKADAVEIVSLERQEGAWRVVGIYVE